MVTVKGRISRERGRNVLALLMDRIADRSAGRSSGTTARSGKMLVDWIRLKRRVNLVMERTNDLKRAERVLARMLQSGKTKVEEDVEREPGVQSLKRLGKQWRSWLRSN